jgi:hypothetical protein
MVAEWYRVQQDQRQQGLDLSAQQIAQRTQEYFGELAQDPIVSAGMEHLAKSGNDDVAAAMLSDPSQMAAGMRMLREAAMEAQQEQLQLRTQSALGTYGALEQAGVLPEGTAAMAGQAISQGVDPEQVYKEAQKAAQEHTKTQGVIRAFRKRTEGIRTILSNPAATARMDPEAVDQIEDLMGDIEESIELKLDPDMLELPGKLDQLDQLMAPKVVRNKLAQMEQENQAMKLAMEQQRQADANAFDLGPPTTQAQPDPGDPSLRTPGPSPDAEAAPGKSITDMPAKQRRLFKDTQLKVLRDIALKDGAPAAKAKAEEMGIVFDTALAKELAQSVSQSKKGKVESAYAGPRTPKF